MVAHDVVVGMADWHRALTLSSEDRQSQPVSDCRDELSLPQVEAKGFAGEGGEPVAGPFS